MLLLIGFIPIYKLKFGQSYPLNCVSSKSYNPEIHNWTVDVVLEV